VRRLAREDSALAHVFAFHHLQVATIALFGEEAQQARLLSDTAAQRPFLGQRLQPARQAHDRHAEKRRLEPQRRKVVLLRLGRLGLDHAHRLA
jgi:hypothetical protein